MPKPPRQVKHPKSPEARQAEVDAILRQLSHLGLPLHVEEPLTNALQEFARTGHSFSDAFQVPDTHVKIVCLLSNQAHIASYVRITSSAPRVRPPGGLLSQA